MSIRQIKRQSIMVMVIVCVCLFGSACKDSGVQQKLVLTTGLRSGELFRIGDSHCKLAEALTYYATLKNQYNAIFGEQIWEYPGDAITMEEHLQEVVLARIAQVKVMNLLGEQYGIELTKEEEEMATEAASLYENTLREEEKAELGLTQDMILAMYLEYAMAEHVYEYMIRDINPEISDDEARIVTVNRILVGHNAYEQAVQARKDLKDGISFQKVAKEYSELETSLVSFGKGEGVLSDELENIAFRLATDEMSDIVETEQGYEIIQCVNTLNREETDQNKARIMEERRKEAFNMQYEAYVDSLVRYIDYELWEEATSNLTSKVTTMAFFELYEDLE